MVFYRKYRPQSLGELIGQEQVKQALQAAFDNQKLAHAYLFYGPKGTGKTSTARILAKMVNCEGKDIPCNSCATCLSITDGSNLDLIEIDAASNRGIDDIRELREKIKLAPSAARKKVYIIDEVHMLTNEAFNALLKTLEEPPSHALFILATTEINKIPQTILSRVQRLDFKAATNEQLREAMLRVGKEEKLKLTDEEALDLLAKKAEGSFRDGLKILDQLSSQEKDITKQLVEESFNAGKKEEILDLLECLSKKDVKGALQLFNNQADKGINLKEFTLSLLDYLRSMLLIKHGVKDEEGLKGMAEKFSSAQLTGTINYLLKALEQMKFCSLPALPLEVALIESCNGGLVVSTEEIAFKGNSETIKLTQVVQKVEDIKKTDDVASTDMLALKDKWQFVLETIRPYNYSLEALLKQAKLISVSEGQVLLEVPYSFHQRILEAPKSRNLLESVLSDILGKSARVSCVLGQRPVRVEELANVEIAQDDEIIRVAAEIFSSEG